MDRSRCNSCNRTLSIPDLVPVFSWVVSRGRCRTCKARVPALYAVAELSLGVVFVLAYQLFGAGLPLLLFALSLFLLTVIVLYDLRHTVVPFILSLLLIATSALFALSRTPAPLLPFVFGIAGIIGLLFWLMYALSKGRAMGLGDAPVALALSLLAGTQAIAGVLFSFWIGAVIGILILVLRRGGPTMGIEVPFVPFLALGFLLALFTGWNPLTILAF